MLLVSLSLVGLSPRMAAQEPEVGSRTQLAQAIDHEIGLQLADQNWPTAEIVNDAQYLRRVTLDLAGRIPTAKEREEFLADTAAGTEAGKREKLVDRLLASPDFAFHLRNELDILLLAQLQWNNEWRNYLLEAMQQQRPIDALVREILLPEKHRPDDKGAVAFLRQRVNNLDALTNDSSSLLFGVNIACAKCHDHPLVPDWQQDHYFGYASFFKRTFGTRRGLLAERFEGELKFTTVKGEEKRSKFMFLSGQTVEEPAITRSEDQLKTIRDQLKKAEQDDKADPPPSPEFSPREALLKLAFETSSDVKSQPLVARNFANRIWARLMGRGLVHPLDQMHSGNPPSHAALLDRLTDELIKAAYDPKPLMRGIVLSDAYARSAQWPHATPQPGPEAFAVAAPRALTPFQYSLSLWIASRNPEKLPGMTKPDDWLAVRGQWEQRSEGFARRFEIPGELFQVGVEEALLLSNNEQTERDYLASNPDMLVGHLKSINDHNQLVQMAYASVFGRAATAEEQSTIANYLTARADRADAAITQFVWALLTSAEFRFNH
ncbi:MAG: DUF1549 domain-containing protein [Pirellulaceae bacterium]|nr:DUF1549 domain-containing protein [Pirellulaceae bacterium]